ncbi:MAG TPA: heparan-alpha-glucosaminide N-acetyltransferase domain-containing protein, partial [Ignavibacteriaceae bacterium]|nr:heparan-alpha-glucosaminide N-acetyltransferase domain-containing protein [Ignavibacteriaceae bacterium]
GAWLVFLELTWVRFGWVFNLDYSFTLGQVIWAIGWSMIVLAGLIHFSTKTIAAAGISMILLHNLFDNVTPHQLGIFGWTWQILHYGGGIVYSPGYRFEAAYPLIPWIGVMAAGYSFGSILLLEESRRRKILSLLGAGLILFFIALRFSNIYGDHNSWKEQKDFIFTILSFINVEKYPPSLLYLSITLGITILSLRVLEKAKGFFAKFFITFGRVPMFYYLLHIPVIHGLAVITAIIAGAEYSFMFGNTPPWVWPGEWGFSLAIVYAFWIGIVILLYPICVWFGNVKSRHKGNRWLSYI